MPRTADKTDPELWEKIKEDVKEGDKGGKPGQWSARKAQIAVNEYKNEGGGYEGEKSGDNHLVQWQNEEWGTRSGHPSEETGERYLPKAARDHLSDAEYKETSDKKRADTRHGKQYSKQPAEIARKTAQDRETGHGEAGAQDDAKPHAAPARNHSHAHQAAKAHDLGKAPSRAALMREAQKRNIPGRSAMSREELARAVGH